MINMCLVKVQEKGQIRSNSDLPLQEVNSCVVWLDSDSTKMLSNLFSGLFFIHK